MKFGCALCLPTLELVSSFSWSAASAPTNGTVKSLRKGETRQPVINPMSLEYSTACGSPWEPSCSKDVTSPPGQSALFSLFAQCHIFLDKSKMLKKIQGLGIICRLLCTQCFNYALPSTICCMLWLIWMHPASSVFYLADVLCQD